MFAQTLALEKLPGVISNDWANKDAAEKMKKLNSATNLYECLGMFMADPVSILHEVLSGHTQSPCDLK